MGKRTSWGKEGLVEFAREHTIGECADKYCCSFSAMATYLSRYKIEHKSSCRTHGCTNTRLFSIWHGMKKRCKSLTEKYYGARGIKVCEEWNDFSCFMEWALSHGYTDSLTIDRIDNNKGYYPANCRWVDYKVQNNNRRNNHLLTYNGATKTVTQWANELGITRQCLNYRLKHWNTERVFNTGKRRK